MNLIFSKHAPEAVEVVLGNLCEEAPLEPFFTFPDGMTSVVIRCANMVTVNPKYSDMLMSVNVGGTRNIITKCDVRDLAAGCIAAVDKGRKGECHILANNVLALCTKYRIDKLVYVSSVHAIPETGQPVVQTEISSFSPEMVVGDFFAPCVKKYYSSLTVWIGGTETERGLFSAGRCDILELII